MLPPSDIEIPQGGCWNEVAALRDVADTDRLSPTGEDVLHIVSINVACLSGITADRSMGKTFSNTATTARPEHVRATVAVFRRNEFLGSSGFSEPLSQSSSPMFAEDSTNRYIATWHGFGSTKSSSLEFEVPIRVNNHFVDQEEFDLVVFLADHSPENGKVLASPIGLGSFVLGGECETSRAFDLRIKRLPSTSVLPAMEIGKNADARDGPAMNVTNLVYGLKDTACKYQLDARGGGFARMSIDWCRKHPQVVAAQPGASPPMREGSKVEGKARSKGSPGAVVNHEDVVLQRSTAQLSGHSTVLTRKINRKPQATESTDLMRDESDVVQNLSMHDAVSSAAAAKMVAKLKFPSRASRKVEQDVVKVELVELTDSLARAEKKEDSDKKEHSAGLRYQIGNKPKKDAIKQRDATKRLVDVESSLLLSFDDESLMDTLRPSPTHHKASGALPIEEQQPLDDGAETAAGISMFTRVWTFFETLLSCGSIQQSEDNASVVDASLVDASIVESKLSNVDTWNTVEEHTWGTVEEDDYTLGTLEKSLADEDPTFLAEFASSTWNALEKDTEWLRAQTNLLTRIRDHKGRERNMSSPTFWSEAAVCHGGGGTISSVKSKKHKFRRGRKSQKIKNRESWV